MNWLDFFALWIGYTVIVCCGLSCALNTVIELRNSYRKFRLIFGKYIIAALVSVKATKPANQRPNEPKP